MLDTNFSTRLQYQTFGAQVIQLDPASIFYVSEIDQNEGRCWRGGQPVIFPQFADRGPIKKHGFARDVFWNLVAEEIAPRRHRLILSVNINKCDFSDWPYEVNLILDVEYTSNLVSQSFEVRNTGREVISWTGGLHPYFSVIDITSASVKGLIGISYKDRYGSGEKVFGEEAMLFDKQPCEKLFNKSPDLQLQTGSRLISLKTSGFDQWMVWNPGQDGAKEISDLPDEDWKKFVCIEPVCVDRPVVLKPGEVFNGMFQIGF